MNDVDHLFKILVFGDGGVGKTSLVRRYTTGLFDKRVKLTIAVEFYSKDVTYNGNKVRLSIWDFGGEDRFRDFLPAYCRGASGGIFLFDITNPSSLHSISDWMQIINQNAPNAQIIVAGAKIDLEESRSVSAYEAMRLFMEFGITGYTEVSSLTGENIEELFQNLIALCWK